MDSRVYKIVIWHKDEGFLFHTGWQQEATFKKTFQSIYEGFPPGTHTLSISRMDKTITPMSAENLYRALWNDEAGKTLDERQKEVDGDDLENVEGLGSADG
tara:strand:- start:4339 stop:4641 length:303 start_codon:yes stop_codon:yes gene_type:complete